MVRSAIPDATRRAAPPETAGLSRIIVDLGLGAGLASVGITSADVFGATRSDLLGRRRAGLHGGMQFTYRNPERSTDPGRTLPGARALVVGAWSYRQAGAGPGTPGPSTRPRGRVARYAQRDRYAELRGALGVVAGHLEALGWQARVVCDDNALVDRAAAQRAGLGWFGKNSLLLLPGLGSWFLLGSVVTDAPLRELTPAEPLAHGIGCGTCSRCMVACPTGALVAPGVLDARRCLAWLVQAEGTFPEEYRTALGDRIYGCDDCQTACPINKVADRRHPPGSERGTPDGADAADSRDTPDPGVDLLDLLASTDAQLLDAHGRWYVPGRDPRYLRRNALVALGNTGDGHHPATESALRRWVADDDPMLAEHARWAAGRLGRSDLVPRAGQDRRR